MPPDLLAERSGIQKGTKVWDIALASLATSILPMATWIVAGLDERFGWSPPITSVLWWFSLLVFVLGWGVVLWAMAANRYFSTLVRLQEKTFLGKLFRVFPPLSFRHRQWCGFWELTLSTSTACSRRCDVLSPALCSRERLPRSPRR
jgi:hypothetical protein